MIKCKGFFTFLPRLELKFLKKYYACKKNVFRFGIYMHLFYLRFGEDVVLVSLWILLFIYMQSVRHISYVSVLIRIVVCKLKNVHRDLFDQIWCKNAFFLSILTKICLSSCMVLTLNGVRLSVGLVSIDQIARYRLAGQQIV